MPTIRINVDGRSWNRRTGFNFAAAFAIAACQVGCSDKASENASGTAKKVDAVIVASSTPTPPRPTPPKPTATQSATRAATMSRAELLAAAAPVPEDTTPYPAAAPPAQTPAVLEGLVVRFGGGRPDDNTPSPATINDRPVEPADLLKVFAASWDEYAAERARQKLPPILSLRISETKPIKPALDVLTHARRTKGCMVRLLATEQTYDPQAGPIVLKLGDEEAAKKSTSEEIVTISVRSDSSGRLEWFRIDEGAPISAEFDRFFRRLNDFAKVRQQRAQAAGQSPPRLELLVEDSLIGKTFLDIALAVSIVQNKDDVYVPYAGFISPLSYSQPPLRGLPKSTLPSITPSTPLRSASSVASENSTPAKTPPPTTPLPKPTSSR